jgi:hypothetical protein
LQEVVFSTFFKYYVAKFFFNLALNCGPDILLCGSFPTELGEMDGRNAAAAIIGFVNGKS